MRREPSLIMPTYKKPKNKKRLVLLDAYAILHRAYHALPEFSSSKGEPTGALFGLSSMLISVIKDLDPDYMVACFDLPEKTYRHEAYDDYKAGRKKTDSELIVQIDRSRDILKSFNIPIYEKSGFEADDVIGTIVEQVKDDPDLQVVIASGDMDTLQLVDDEKVVVYTLRKGLKDTVIYDEKTVKERYGFGPEMISDYKGLRGDPSDNIPGIAGIGEKTATQLIVAFGSIENMYKILKKDEAQFEKKGIKARPVTLLKDGAEDAEFSKMLATIRRDVPVDFKLPKVTWKESFDHRNVVTLFSDFEFRTLKARLKSMYGDNENTEQQTLDDVLEENVPAEALKEVSVALWLLKSDITKPELSDILEYARAKTFAQASEYIFKELKEKKLEGIFNTIEKPLIPVVDTMNKTGVAIDKEVLKRLSKKYHIKLDALEKKIHTHAGTEFNINSPKQMGEALFDTMELKPAGRIKKTTTGQYSTRESELQKMIELHPIIPLILEYREFQKLLSTYIDSLPGKVDKDGRLRAEFVQAGTTTGRMASHNPNLQNIPIKSDLGRHIRDAFVAEKGFMLVAFDYSQIELRIAAILSGDEKLIETFRENKDIHTRVASEIFNVTPDEVTKTMRSRAKVVNFGILYGMGVNALKGNLGVSQVEAREYLQEYFQKFSGLSSYIEQVKRDAQKNKYTETLFGRRRYFEGFDSKLPFIRAQAERMAVNAPIQGTQADIIKLAMVRIDEFLKTKKLTNTARLILQVHDELIYEIQESKIESLAPEIKHIMEGVMEGKDTKGVPIITGAEAGPSWGDMKSL